MTILIGILFVIGGLSGGFVLKGTESTTGLAWLGLLMILWGLWSGYRKAKKDM
jgi:hypothetical protein